MREVDVRTDDGRVLHAYDMGPTGRSDELVVLWHHGTPNTGSPPEPLFDAARALGIRWIGYDRPSYGGSSPHPDATVASAAADARQVADQLGINRFAVFGHSGGGPRALACAALLADRVHCGRHYLRPSAVAGRRTRLFRGDVSWQCSRTAGRCSGSSRTQGGLGRE